MLLLVKMYSRIFCFTEIFVAYCKCLNLVKVLLQNFVFESDLVLVKFQFCVCLCMFLLNFVLVLLQKAI